MLDINASELQDIRNLSPELLPHLYSAIIPEDRRPVSDTFWTEYNITERAIGYRACLLLWALTATSKVPREFQLHATIAILSNKDLLLDVGTNAGKTMCMILPCLVSPDTLAVVFSPLKRLQAVQVLTFEEFGIRAIAINEDTPNDPKLWKVCLILGTSRICVPICHPLRIYRTGPTKCSSSNLNSSVRQMAIKLASLASSMKTESSRSL